MLLRSKRTQTDHLSLCAVRLMSDKSRILLQSRLTEEGYGNTACAALLAIGTESLVADAMNADEVVILDGCPKLCAKKIAGAQGIRQDNTWW